MERFPGGISYPKISPLSSLPVQRNQTLPPKDSVAPSQGLPGGSPSLSALCQARAKVQLLVYSREHTRGGDGRHVSNPEKKKNKFLPLEF